MGEQERHGATASHSSGAGDQQKAPLFLLVSISLIFTSFQAGPTTFSSLFGDSSSSLPPPSLGAQLGDQARARARGRAEARARARARARQPKQLEGNQLDQQVKHTDLHSREKIEKWFAIFLGVTKGGVDQETDYHTFS